MSQQKRKIALITGGTRGIGRAISLRLAREGYSVIATYVRNRNAASDLDKVARAEALALQTVRGDIRDAGHITSLIQMVANQQAELGVVVHSAASGVHRTVEKLTAKHLAWTIETNVIGAHDLISQLLPFMARGSRIIGISSLGSTRVLPAYAAIGSSKGALDALFRHYAKELAPKGVSVNLICPGLVLTEGSAVLPEIEARKREASENTPTGRLTKPEDIANVVSFLCSEAAGQIIGQTIIVDGGYSLG
jgi:enoyl-[acyl-carrier protein] reductase III